MCIIVKHVSFYFVFYKKHILRFTQNLKMYLFYYLNKYIVQFNIDLLSNFVVVIEQSILMHY